jgi:hypothetical protein
MKLAKIDKPSDRRRKNRFPIHRELKYKLLRETSIVETGEGQTADIGSGGVCFIAGRKLQANCYIELSISWPVLLNDNLPMRLIAFGRVIRSEGPRCACTIEKYEFRTQSRAFQTPTPIRTDTMLQRWVESLRKETALKSRAAAMAV